MYDAQLGRWHVVDAKSEHFYEWTPYKYSLNNPILYNDPDGNCETCKEFLSNTADAIGQAASAVKNSISGKIEFSTSVGPQAGVKLGDIVDVDVSVASVELTNSTTELKNGKLTESRQLGETKVQTTSGSNKKVVTTPGVKVENKVGVTVAGFGFEVGQSQNIDGELSTSGYKTFTKAIGTTGGAGATVTKETDKSGKTTVKSESGFTIGAKFIVGFEMKIVYDKDH